MNRFYELLKNNPHFLHGGDYNPDQWQDIKKTVDEDIELMKQAGINCASLGIFSWAQIEKEEGKYDFSWMDYVFDKFEENGMNLFLATPSAAMPAWKKISGSPQDCARQAEKRFWGSRQLLPQLRNLPRKMQSNR